MGVSLNGGTNPHFTPKMIIFSRKTRGCWGNPPFKETHIYIDHPWIGKFIPYLEIEFLKMGLDPLGNHGVHLSEGKSPKA